MLWTILMVLLILWLLGLIGGIGGSLIHLLLVVALVVLIFQLITGRRAVVQQRALGLRSERFKERRKL